MDIDDTTKAAIIAAAHAAASTEIALATLRAGLAADDGAEPDTSDVLELEDAVAIKAAEIAAQVTGDSPASRAIDQIAACKVFTATVVSITKEARSTRGLVTLKTRPSKFAEDGIETARTERTDNAIGRAMAKRIQKELVGHRVLVYIELETYNDGAGKVRVIRHVVDLGVDGDHNGS